MTGATSDLPRVRYCCYLFELRAGCVILAIINAMISLGISLALIMCSYTIKDSLEVIKKRDPVDTELVSVTSGVYTITLLLGIMLAIKIVFYFGLVYAVFMDIRQMIRYYAVCWLVFTALYIVCVLKTISYMSGEVIFAELGFLVLNCYYIIVIRSYLISLNEDGVI